MTPDAKSGSKPRGELSGHSAEPGGHRAWLTPTGISAIAGLLGVIVTLLTVFNRDDGGSSPSVAGAVQEASVLTTLDPQNGPTIGDTSQLLDLLRDVGADTLDASQEPYADYRPVESPGGSLSTELPLEWRDTSFHSGISAKVVLISAADERLFSKYRHSTPGLLYEVSDQLDLPSPQHALDTLGLDLSTDCKLVTSGAVRTDETNGIYELWHDCGKTRTLVLQLATHNERGFWTYLYAPMASRRDVEAIARFYSHIDVTTPIKGVGQKVGEKVEEDTGQVPGRIIR
jgi:hypothetical protein